MTIWSDRPEIEDTVENYKLLRIPQATTIRGIVLSHSMLWTKTHFFRGRTKPCLEIDCDACKNRNVARPKGYLLVQGIKSRDVRIFEMTARGFAPFDAFFTQHGTCRGAVFTASRLNNKANGPIHIIVDPEPMTSQSLPPDCDLRQMLERMWEVHPDDALDLGSSRHDQTLLPHRP